jgi:hypothetical protein
MSQSIDKLSQGYVSSTALLGAALGDGATTGLVGGILGIILPILALFSGNPSLAALGVIVNVIVYVVTGISAGYLFYSRNIGRGWVVLASGIVSGLVAGSISGVALGLSLARVPAITAQLDANMIWATWGILSGLGAAFICASTVWIPGLFFRSEHGYANTGRPAPTISGKELSQYEQVGQRFKKRMQARLVIGAITIALVFAWYFCQSLVR